jgi:hypothetical protein
MKKPEPNPFDNPMIAESKSVTIAERRTVVRRSDGVRRSGNRIIPVNQIFSVRPDADLATLLAHASQNLASLNAMTLDFAIGLEGEHRSKAVAIHHLTGLAEMLVNSALGKLDPLQACAAEPKPFRCH